MPMSTALAQLRATHLPAIPRSSAAVVWFSLLGLALSAAILSLLPTDTISFVAAHFE
jgi:hypothetical protein